VFIVTQRHNYDVLTLKLGVSNSSTKLPEQGLGGTAPAAEWLKTQQIAIFAVVSAL